MKARFSDDELDVWTAATGIKFATDPDEKELIKKIAERACASLRGKRKAQHYTDTLMDVSATHANGNPLRLADLLAANDFNFHHDIGGISKHLNRSTGKLEDFFSPRFSAPSDERRAAK